MQFTSLSLNNHRQISPAAGPGFEIPTASPVPSRDEHGDDQCMAQYVSDLPNKYLGDDSLVADMWQAVDEVRCGL
jgi:hypothetical protein